MTNREQLEARPRQAAVLVFFSLKLQLTPSLNRSETGLTCQLHLCLITISTTLCSVPGARCRPRSRRAHRVPAVPHILRRSLPLPGIRFPGHCLCSSLFKQVSGRPSERMRNTRLAYFDSWLRCNNPLIGNSAERLSRKLRWTTGFLIGLLNAAPNKSDISRPHRSTETEHGYK